ncbi:TfuA-like protein [Streptomyces uncialis]|uniref:TfuA-like protein n=1 Tax=Streptomyces uncialis TaxID=1048205 RepID=UPI003865690E|nr:TfuA domain-containing protein [Streptomyces uncialis]
MEKGRIHVYVGPTCQADDILQRFPEVVVHPPVSHGSFFSPEIEYGDVAVVVDGFYHHRLGPRHKEYLYALDRGVTVIGTASIGALRALELSAYGMAGFGVVHQLYRAGVFDGDDAVAVAHEEDAPYASLSVPLVNLYTAAQAARAARVLAAGDIDDVVSALRSEYYPTRTPARVVHILRHTGRPRMAEWYERQVDDDPYVFDQKRQDCLGAIDAARHLVAAGAVGRVTGADGADWKTLFLRTWSNHFVGMTGSPPLAHRLAYQQIFNPGYARIWERYLDETYRGHQQRAAVGNARDLEDSVSQLIGAERFPCATEGKKADWLFDFICPVPDLGDPREVELLLSAEESTDAESVVRHLRQTREFTDGVTGPMAGNTSNVLPEEAGKILLCRIWDIPSEELSRECRSRGIPNIKAAVRILQPFIVGAINERTQLRAETV